MILAFVIPSSSTESGDEVYDIISAIFLSFLVFTVTLYAPARLILLIESFTTLRDMPERALLDLDWTNFIPISSFDHVFI